MNLSPAGKRRHPRDFVGLTTAAVALGIGGCQSPQPGGRGSLDDPIFGPARPTEYVLATSDKLHAHDLATVARILRRYKTLDAAERALVANAVSRRLNALIAIEVRTVAAEPQFRARRSAIRRLPDRIVAAIRTVELDGEIRAEAARRLYRRLGGMVATAVHGPDNKSAVVFGRVGAGGVAVERAAYEVDTPLDALTEGARIQRDVQSTATFLTGQPVRLSAP